MLDLGSVGWHPYAHWPVWLTLYDPAFVPGRPLLYFAVDEPATYQIQSQTVMQGFQTFLVPYKNLENESRIVFWIWLQILVVVGLVAFYFGRKYVSHRRQAMATANENRKLWDEFRR